jgi:hypothetical protein
VAYPATGNPKTELLINGTWTDVSSYVRADPGVTITRGRADEQSRTAAQTCSLWLNNRDGRFSNRNPGGAYYGLLPRNTQVRVTAGTGDTYLRMLYYNDSGLNNVQTPDSAALSITGDTEWRFDIQPHSWRPHSTGLLIASKWDATGNQRSWAVWLTPDGYLVVRWSVDGTNTNAVQSQSTATVPAASGRLSIKVTLDVDNGAAGNTVAFYTASTIGGSYTQLGASVITAGTTSIFDSTAAVVLGTGASNTGIFSAFDGYGGKVYAFQLYSGIAGVVKANPDFSAWSVGDTSKADAAGNTWTIVGTARITTDRLRFWGELSTLPQRWDKSQTDIYVPVTASGQIRRLSQGASPLRSPLYRRISRTSGVYAYWPLEDGSTSTTAANVITNSKPATVTAVTFAGDTTLPGADGSLVFTGSTSKVVSPLVTGTNTGTLSFVFYVKLPSMPAAQADLMTLYTNGTAKKIVIGLDAANWRTDFYDADNASLDSFSTAAATVLPVNQWIGVNLLLQTSGGNVSWSQRWHVVATETVLGIGPRTYAGSPGVMTGFSLAASTSASYQTGAFSHIMFANTDVDFDTVAFVRASNAFATETAVTRFVRLCGEESVPFEVWGKDPDSESMGYQTTSTLMDLLYDCADADGGMVSDARDNLALVYRTRIDLENRHDVTLSYSSAHLAEVPEPTEDDQGITNDVTVRRPNGSVANYTVDSGSMSTLASPNGIGRYATDVTKNLSTDDRLPAMAQWLAFVGTWDDARYPNLTVGLHRSVFTANTTLTGQVMAANLGDTVTLSGLPSFVSYDDVLLLVQGYTETLGKYLWTLTLNTTPAGPYRLPYASSDDFVPRADASNTVLNAAVTSSATSIGLKTTTGQLWVTTAANPAEFPFNIKVAGEVMTVTAIVGTSSPQTATVTRSVNGVVKAQVINAPIYLSQPSYVSA